jgi:uncharacterized protein
MPTNPTLLQRQTSLSANIVQFCRYLRTEGFNIAAPEEADALRTIEILEPYQEQAQLCLALKTILSRSREQAERFDELFDYYFKQLEKAIDSKVTEQEKEKDFKPKNTAEQQFVALRNWLHGSNAQDEEITQHTYSADSVLGKKDFAHLTEDEQKEVFELILMLARRLAQQRNRRYKKDKNGILDLRRTLRQNLRRGGEMLELLTKKRQKRRVQLVLLCDVSQSMELYSRFLLQFAYAFQQVFKRIETFVFSTELIKTSEILRGTKSRSLSGLRGSDFTKMLNELSETVPNWSGGTRIGESLRQFTEQHSQKCLTSKTIVLIMSDGWDTGEVEVLEQAMKTIHQKAKKVIWLNPLAGNPNYEPNTACMEKAMPYIDVLNAGHNVESIKNLGKFL